MKRLLTITSIATVLALSAAPVFAAPKHKSKPKPDRVAPVTTFKTGNNASISNAVLTDDAERMVKGTAIDARSRVSMVKVEITPCQSDQGACELSELRADEYKVLSISGSALRCGPKKRSCGWSFEAPETLGPYQVRAWSYDAAHNMSKVRTIRINVTL